MKKLRFLGALAFSLCFLQGNVWWPIPLERSCFGLMELPEH
jgi:hypothetical protein